MTSMTLLSLVSPHLSPPNLLLSHLSCLHNLLSYKSNQISQMIPDVYMPIKTTPNLTQDCLEYTWLEGHGQSCKFPWER
jgi:hypothetical protein